MRTIGLLGGVSWESTREYYRIINQRIQAELGGLHSGAILLHSFNFEDIVQKQRADDWAGLNQQLIDAALGLERAGADAILICSNYMSKCADAIEQACTIPVLHITDALAEAIAAQGHATVGLLGARGTMCENFYRPRLQKRGLNVIIPEPDDIEMINRTIFDEFCKGQFTQSTREAYLAVMQRLADKGAQSVILGCTEIEQLIRPQDTSLPIHPSAEIHANAAVNFMLGRNQKAVAS